MGYKFSLPSLNALLKDLSEDYLIFAPKRFEGEAPIRISTVFATEKSNPLKRRSSMQKAITR